MPGTWSGRGWSGRQLPATSASLPHACTCPTCSCPQWNTGPDAYRRAELGPTITVVRRINANTGGGFEILDHNGRVVSTLAPMTLQGAGRAVVLGR